MFHPIKTIVSGLALTVLASVAQVKQCDAEGGLRHLGTTNDGTRSVWLSGTSAVDFKL